MKKFAIFFFLLIAVLGIAIYGFLTAPQKVKQVKLEIVKGSGSWKAQISQHIFPFIKPGENIGSEEIEYLKELANSLPWVKKCDIVLKNGTLIFKIVEAKPSLGLFFEGSTYFIRDNGFVLAKKDGVYPISPIYFYKGNSSPFMIENGFTKLKSLIRMEIALAKERIKNLNINGMKPKVTITDIGVNLIFPETKTIVYLGNSGNSWNNFIKFYKLINKLTSGVYDFRFSNLLIRGRNQCLNKKF